MKFVLPEVFEIRMKHLLEDDWQKFYDSYEADKYQALRLNVLKRSLDEEKREQIKNKFRLEERVAWAEQGFYYDINVRPGKHPYHEIGVYYIQEPSAMSAAAILAPQPGMRVLDLCAAPGGKSTQLASMLQGRGLLVANEINATRCKILSQNIERMGITNAIVTNEDSERLATHFGCFFDRILVDAPCSGEGMFRKNLDAMEEWSEENVGLCANRQREILTNAAKMLLPGGKLVYSTCTFSPEENEQTVAEFLENHPEFELLPIESHFFSDARPDWVKGENISDEIRMSISRSKRLWPHKLNGEGHYVALFQKAGKQREILEVDTLIACEDKEELPTKSRAKGKMNKQKKDLDFQLLDDFFQVSVSPVQHEWIRRGKLRRFGDHIYRLPDCDININGIHVLRAGLHVGELKKNRFEPAHALALVLGKKDVNLWIDLSNEQPECYGFFRGESFVVTENSVSGNTLKGWCLVCVDGLSAGWGKIAGGQLKNHYPKGLRRDLVEKE